MLPAWHPILPFTEKCDTTFDRHRLATIRYFFYWYIYYPYIMHTHLSMRFFHPAARIRAYFFGLRTTVLLWYISVFFIKTKVGEYCTGYGFYPYGNTKSLRPYFFYALLRPYFYLFMGEVPQSVGYHTYYIMSDRSGRLVTILTRLSATS